MARYLLTNVRTNEHYEVEAWCAEVGCQRLGWSAEDCDFLIVRDDPITHLEPPLKLWNA